MKLDHNLLTKFRSKLDKYRAKLNSMTVEELRDELVSRQMAVLLGQCRRQQREKQSGNRKVYNHVNGIRRALEKDTKLQKKTVARWIKHRAAKSKAWQLLTVVEQKQLSAKLEGEKTT